MGSLILRRRELATAFNLLQETAIPTKSSTRRPWTQDELLVAFRLYCRTPFGKLHQHNPEIIELARLMRRTPSAVGMKACNFASLDPIQRARNISALGNVSRADRQLWEAFEEDPETIAAEAEGANARLSGQEAPLPPELNIVEDIRLPTGPTETTRLVRIRRVQAFFRAAVLASYEYRCALSDISIVPLLNASHIIPWNANVERRADPRNGIALNALYDRAFDRGLITFDEKLKLKLSNRLKQEPNPRIQYQHFQEIEGRSLRMPSRFSPDAKALEHHRLHIFVE